MESSTAASISAAGGMVATMLLLTGLAPRVRLPVLEALALLHMWANPKERNVQLQACVNVAVRAKADEYSQSLLFHVGGLQLPLDAIRRFEHDSSVLKVCAYAVFGMTHQNPQIRAAAGQAGAVELLVRAMQRFPDDPDMQFSATLGTMLVSSPENRMRWAAAGGIETAVAAVRRHYNNAFVQSEAWKAFAAGSSDPNELRFMEAGGMGLVVQVMRDRLEVDGLIEQVLQSTRAITAYSDDLRSASLEAGYVSEIIAAMQMWPRDLGVQAPGCANLANIGEGNASHREALLQAGTVDVVAAAVRGIANMASLNRGKQEPELNARGECFRALEALTVSDAAKPAVTAALRKEDIIAAMRYAPEDWKVQTGGSALLRLLAE